MPSLFSKIACGITAALCLSGQVAQAGSTHRILGERPDDHPGHWTHVENPLLWAELPRVDCKTEPKEVLESIFAAVYDRYAEVPEPHCIAPNLFFQAAPQFGGKPGAADPTSGGGYPKSMRRSWILNYWAAQELWQFAHEYQHEAREDWELYKLKFATALQTIVGFAVPSDFDVLFFSDGDSGDKGYYPISVGGFALPTDATNAGGYETPFLTDPTAVPIGAPVQPPIVTEASIQPEDPSFAFWFRWLEQTYPALGADADADINPGLEQPMASPVIPFETQKAIELAYTNVGSVDRGRRARTVVDVYTELTGCAVPASTGGDFKNANGGGIPGFDPSSTDTYGVQLQKNIDYLHRKGCKDGVIKAFTASGKYSAAGGPTGTFSGGEEEAIASTDLCFEEYLRSTPPKERDPAGVRFILDWCQDANALNTGAGVTFNLAANPLVCKPKDRQTVKERYGPPEFTIDGCSGGVEANPANPEDALNNVGCATWEALNVAKRTDTPPDGEGPYFYIDPKKPTAAQQREPKYQFLTRGYCR